MLHGCSSFSRNFKEQSRGTKKSQTHRDEVRVRRNDGLGFWFPSVGLDERIWSVTAFTDAVAHCVPFFACVHLRHTHTHINIYSGREERLQKDRNGLTAVSCDCDPLCVEHTQLYTKNTKQSMRKNNIQERRTCNIIERCRERHFFVQKEFCVSHIWLLSSTTASVTLLLFHIWFFSLSLLHEVSRSHAIQVLYLKCVEREGCIKKSHKLSDLSTCLTAHHKRAQPKIQNPKSKITSLSFCWRTTTSVWPTHVIPTPSLCLETWTTAKGERKVIILLF